MPASQKHSRQTLAACYNAGMKRPDDSVSNKDIMAILQDLMQITLDGFTQVNAKLSEHDVILAEHSAKLNEHTVILNGHGQEIGGLRRDVADIKDTVHRIDNEQHAQTNDIVELYDRVVILEKKAA